MKKLIAIISFIAMATVAMAQSAEQIISRMEEEMNKQNVKDGFAMTIDIKVMILGTLTSRSYSVGDKIRMETTVKDSDIITWQDGKTEWTYNAEKNEIEIKNMEPKEKSESEGDAELFKGITDGYDVSIDKETATDWHIRCKKSKKNTDKDAPKKMDLVVEKGTYLPVSLSASMSGVSMTMRDFSYDVTEEQVTFNPKNYPNATIIDKR